jgi:DNA-binding CsgD family transcriptional regulator
MNLLRLQLEGKPLTEPELEVLRAAAEGLSAQETAERLLKSRHTITTQRRTLQAKLGARNLPHAIALAYHYRVLQPPRFR